MESNDRWWFQAVLFSTRTLVKISIFEYVKFSQVGWFDHHWYSTGWSVGGWSYIARSIRFYLTAPRGVDVYHAHKEKDSSLFMEEIGVENLPFFGHILASYCVNGSEIRHPPVWGNGSLSQFYNPIFLQLFHKDDWPLLGGWAPRTDVSSDRIIPIYKPSSSASWKGVPTTPGLGDLRSPRSLATYPWTRPRVIPPSCWSLGHQGLFGESTCQYLRRLWTGTSWQHTWMESLGQKEVRIFLGLRDFWTICNTTSRIVDLHVGHLGGWTMPQKLILDRTSTFYWYILDVWVSLFGVVFLVPWLCLRITVCLKANCKLWKSITSPAKQENICRRENRPFVPIDSRFESSDGYTEW